MNVPVRALTSGRRKSKIKIKRSGKSEEEKDLEKRTKIWGILFLITFITCFFITGMEALAATAPEGEAVPGEPVTGVPIENTTLMYAVEKVNVRKGPGTDAEILGELAQGEMVFAVELLEEGWYRVVFNGETGYVRQDFLAIYGIAGEWAAPGQPVEPDVAGQDSAATGKKTIKGDDGADDGAENTRTPASAKNTKDKKGNASTIIIIAVAVLLILGYSVVQIVKEKRENEKGNDADGEVGQQLEIWDEEAENGEWDEEALDEEDFAAESFAEWEDGESFAAEDSAEWEDGEDTAAAGYEKAAGKAENPAEDEMVIWDIDEE